MQFPNVARSFVHQHVDRVGHAKSVARRHRVARMQLGRVVCAERRGDAALRVAGIALSRIGLGENHDVAGLGERDRGTQTGNAAADHEKVATRIHDAILAFRAHRLLRLITYSSSARRDCCALCLVLCDL